MYKKMKIGGEDCNVCLNKSGDLIRGITVMVGPSDEPGWRSKDGATARSLRWSARQSVLDAITLPLGSWILDNQKFITVAARYSCLRKTETGLVREDGSGRVIGIYIE